MSPRFFTWFAVPTLTSGLVLALAGCTSPATTAAVAPAAPPMAAGGEKMAMETPTTKGTLTVLSPANGATIRTIDIPVRVAVSNFTVSKDHVGMPDVPDEGHIHVMYDGMNMGVLFNFYTSPDFTLPGEGLTPGQHTLILDLATNTHEDIESTAQKVTINYDPSRPVPLPTPLATTATPGVKILSPANGVSVGPQFTLQVRPVNFEPCLGCEGKRNVHGIGHYHVFVDMKMSSMPMEGGMMSMAGMVGMPGSNTIPLDLSAWPNGQHTITVETVQNDHTPIPGSEPAMITINLHGAGQS